MASSSGAGSTEPATRSAELNAATPKEALQSLNIALRDGNSSEIRALFLTRNEEGLRLVSAMADYSAALVMLHQAAEKAYGIAGANSVTGDIDAQSREGLAAIEKADVVITGDNAIVRFRGATDPPVTLIRVDGVWKLPLKQLLEGADRQAEQRRFKELTAQAASARQTAEEVKAGKYREGPLKVAEVWRTRLLEPATTRPTTKP